MGQVMSEQCCRQLSGLSLTDLTGNLSRRYLHDNSLLKDKP